MLLCFHINKLTKIGKRLYNLCGGKNKLLTSGGNSMIKKLRLKIIINCLKKYLKKFFFKLGYEEMTKIECKQVENGEYLVRIGNGEYEAKLICLNSTNFEFYITLFKNEEVKETISFDVLALGKLKLKVDIKPKKYEIERKTKKQVINLISRKTELYLFRSKKEKERNVCYALKKPLMKSVVLDVQKLINVSR